MLKRLEYIFLEIMATGFYLGKIPIMPGTFGSLLAIPLGYILTFVSLPIKIVSVVMLILVGIYSSDRYSKSIGKSDPGEIVIDEYAALLIFYIIFPFKPIYIISGFILFRIFDISKPFPIKYFESFEGGVGIMLDDIMAIVYSIGIFLLLKFIYNEVV